MPVRCLLAALLLALVDTGAAHAAPGDTGTGSHELLFRIEPIDALPGEARLDDREAVDRATRAATQERLARFGMKGAKVELVADHRLAVRWTSSSLVRRKDWSERIKAELSRWSAGVEFRMVADESVPDRLDLPRETGLLQERLAAADAEAAALITLRPGGRQEIAYRWARVSDWARAGAAKPQEYLLLELDPAESFTVEDVERAFASVDQNGKPAIGFEMKESRARAFGDFTEKHRGRRLAIVLGGEVASTPVLQSRIESNGLIAGGQSGFTSAETREILRMFRRNPLPARLTLVGES